MKSSCLLGFGEEEPDKGKVDAQQDDEDNIAVATL
jgi:hypothetical protein